MSHTAHIKKKKIYIKANDEQTINELVASVLLAKAINGDNRAITELNKKKQNIEIERGVQESLLLKSLEEIKDKTITIKGKANEKGSLFKAIHKKEIVEEMARQHHADIAEEFIILEKPIKEVGEFEIPIEIKHKKSSFKLVIEKI